MDQHIFFFQDDKLTAATASLGTLKIIVGGDGISMLALSAKQEVLGLAAIQVSEKILDNQLFESEFVALIKEQKLLSFTFGTVSAALSTPWVSLVPQRLFSPHDYQKYFQLLHPLPADTIFGHQELPSFGCYLVWGAPPSYQYFIDRYKPQHLAASLIQSYQGLASQEGCSIFLNLRGNKAQITVFDLRSLVFFNTFDFNKPADLLYYVLLVYDQFKQSPELLPLQLTGGLIEGSEHYKMLYRYIKTIRFVAPEIGSLLPNGENALPAHCWFDLISL